MEKETGTFERVIQGDVLGLRVMESTCEFLIKSGYIVVRVTMKKGKLQIMIERSDNIPITLEDCENVSKRLSLLLDHEEWMSSCHEVEVSSPGINRPLTRLCDFHRFAGSRIKIRGQKPINDFGRTIIGRLFKVDSSGKALKVEIDRKDRSFQKREKNRKKGPVGLSEIETEVSKLLEEDKFSEDVGVGLNSQRLNVQESPLSGAGKKISPHQSSSSQGENNLRETSSKSEGSDLCLVNLDNIVSVSIEAKQKEDIHDKGVSSTQASWLQECERFLSKTLDKNKISHKKDAFLG